MPIDVKHAVSQHFCHLSLRVIVDVVTDVLADVEVDSARLLEVEVLGGDARQP